MPNPNFIHQGQAQGITMNMPVGTPTSTSNTPLWAAVAVLGVAVLAMGAALIRTQNPQPEPRTAVLSAAAIESVAMSAGPAASVATPQDLGASSVATTQQAPSAPAAKTKTHTRNAPLAQNKTGSTATQPAATEVLETTNGPRVVLPQNPEPAVARATAPARVICAACGTVERVTAVEVEGTGSGAGAIAGGVLGAVVGNQVGGGDGKTLATILGAVGGGMAGNVVEKKMKKVTQFDVSVRMDDGSRRTLRQPTSPAVGSAVVVNGDNLQPAAR
jgi:outer membrane lipoprotein SlyB